MLGKKKPPTLIVKNNQFSLFSDCADLEFRIILQKEQDGWFSYQCSLHLLDSSTSQFRLLFSTASNSVINNISGASLADVSRFFRELPAKGAGTHRFVAGTHDFGFLAEVKGDVFRVTCRLDLSGISHDAMEAGNWDSELSLTFNSGTEELKSFCSGLDGFVTATAD